MSQFFLKVLDYLQRLFMTVAAPLGILLLTFEEFSNLLGFLTIRAVNLALGNLGVSTNFLTVAIDWTIVNAFVPISQLWGMFLIYLGFISGVLIFRWIKSVIPTVSN